MNAGGTEDPALASRAAVLDLLDAVLHRKRPLDDAFAAHAGIARLASRDRAFARNLTAATLRHLGQVDHAVGQCLEKPLPRNAMAVRDILRMGAAQLLFLQTPPHAAADTAVSLTRTRGFAGFAKLVNAVMRRLGREGRTMAGDPDGPRMNTPDWLWESWTSAYGGDTARAIAAAHMVEAPLDITVKEDVPAWAERLNGILLATGSLRLAAPGPVTELDGFNDGAWWVQDAAAALPAKLLGDVRDKTVIDLCAAPGGKAAQLASSGARVTAVDRSGARLKRLHENMTRLSLTVETVTADAAQWKPAAPVDAVLLDAPCSATGTIRRHPEVARLKTRRDITKLADLQDRLLEAAAVMIRPGGTLVYCVCSLEPEEGPERIRTFLDTHSGMKRTPLLAEEVGGLEQLINADGDLRTLPCHLADLGGLDGFYAARLRRRP